MSKSILKKKYISYASVFALGLIMSAIAASASTTISTNVQTDGSISASSTLQSTGDLTTFGNATFGDAATDINLFTGTLQASTTALFSNGIVSYGNNKVAPGYGTDTITAGTLNLGTSTATKVIIGSSSAKVGIASTTPYVALGVTGTTTASAGMVIGAGGSQVNQLLFGTCSVNLPSITASSTGVATCTATGVGTGDQVFVTPNSLPDFVFPTGASSTAANTIQVSAFNAGSLGASAGAVDPVAATWSWLAVH